uniref:Interleukin 10 receptor, alpha n=1 Tax=Scleropages formosus TaxID=113540 RepID=A0A8C9RH17_SCLFO
MDLYKRETTDLCYSAKIKGIACVLMFRNTAQFQWAAIQSCSVPQKTECDLSEIINMTASLYWIRVRLSTGQNVSSWSKVRVSKLLPPTFSLSGNSSSLNIRIKTKPVLREIFKFGLNYQIYLKEKGNDKTWQWPDDEEGSDVNFDFLQWGQEYCVCSRVEDRASSVSSALSSEQCLLLPTPGTTPMLLCMKSPGSGWNPLTVGQVPVEIVTDKGFLLLSRKAEEKTQRIQKMIGVEKDIGRRGSMDSGVSMEQQSSDTDGERTGEVEQQRKEDSGCGSLAEGEGSTGRGELTRMSMLDERNHNWSEAQQRKDTAMAVRSQYGDGSLEVENSGLGPEVRVALNYARREQGPSFMQVRDKTPSDVEISVAVAVGYRPSQLACVCSGQGLCLWCRVGSHHEAGTEDSPGSASNSLFKDNLGCAYNTTDHSSQYRASSPLCFEDESPNTTCSQSTRLLGKEDISVHPFILPTDSTDSAPLLQCAPESILLDNGLDNSISTFPGLSLHDIELTFG